MSELKEVLLEATKEAGKIIHSYFNGAFKIDNKELSYYGDSDKANFLYKNDTSNDKNLGVFMMPVNELKKSATQFIKSYHSILDGNYKIELTNKDLLY